MILSTRNKLIFSLRNRGFTLQQIANEVNLSSERVRQVIEQKDLEFCDIHNNFYKKNCYRCYIKQNYIDKIEQISTHNLMDEISRLSQPNRQKEVVAQRQALVKLLKDKYQFSFHEIAKLLERDHTSIMHLYNKKITI